MTDWLSWLLEELEEDKDQGEDLDLRGHLFPREKGGKHRGPHGNETDSGAPAEPQTEGSAAEMDEMRDGPLEERSEKRDGDGGNDALLLAARRLNRVWPEPPARRPGNEGTGLPGTEKGQAADGGGIPARRRTTFEGAEGQRLLTETGLYGSLRRAGMAVGQVPYLRQPGPTVIQEPEPAAGQGPTPAELDRIFQRDARRYDGGFTLF